jgi:hypothetical protein
MNSSKPLGTLLFRSTVILCLLGLLALQLAQHFRHLDSQTESNYRHQLVDLVWKLHDGGMDFRVLSQRPDGLWDAALYLTTTEKTLREIAQVPVNPRVINEWKGSVAVMRINALPSPESPQETWGNDCLVEGDFVFFGDKDCYPQFTHICTRTDLSANSKVEWNLPERNCELK